MRSLIQKESYDSVKIFWLDREELRNRIDDAAANLIASVSAVERVLLFGSAATGRSTPASDVDIIIIVSSSEKRFIDRAADFIDYFSDIDLCVDLFVYTRDEITVDPPQLYRTAVKTGIVLAEK